MAGLAIAIAVDLDANGQFWGNEWMKAPEMTWFTC
jgi:hypothetical protein